MFILHRIQAAVIRFVVHPEFLHSIVAKTDLVIEYVCRIVFQDIISTVGTDPDTVPIIVRHLVFVIECFMPGIIGSQCVNLIFCNATVLIRDMQVCHARICFTSPISVVLYPVADVVSLLGMIDPFFSLPCNYKIRRRPWICAPVDHTHGATIPVFMGEVTGVLVA